MVRSRMVLAHIKALVEERAVGEDILRPSPLWGDVCRYFNYVFSLDEAELQYIRRHTYHLTSDIYQHYVYATDDYRRLILDWQLRAVEALDGFYVDETGFGIGVDGEYGRTSIDAIRYLGVLVDLKEALFDRLRPRTVLEFGGGYGGLARTMVSYLPDAAYCVCDLEETLFFSYNYLCNLIGEDRVHFQMSPLVDGDLLPGHVYLVPQIRFEYLKAVRFDLGISHQSFQEMRVEQIERYLSYVETKASYFYSCNLRAVNQNQDIQYGLVPDLTAMLDDRLGAPVWQGCVEEPGLQYGDRIEAISRRLYVCSS